MKFTKLIKAEHKFDKKSANESETEIKSILNDIAKRLHEGKDLYMGQVVYLQSHKDYVKKLFPDDVDMWQWADIPEEEWNNKKSSKHIKSKKWSVEKINENDWTIKSPDGMYKDENGKEYHFKTKEDALEELDYLRAEHKFDKKSYKYPRIEKEGDIYHVLYAEGTKSKQFDNKKDAEEFKKSIRSKLNKKAGESYGWIVNNEDAWDKLWLFVDAFGEKEALEALASAMGRDALSDNLAYIFRMYDFKEGCSDYEPEEEE